MVWNKVYPTHFDQKSKSELRLDYIFSNKIDEITTLTTLYTNYTDHNALHACFSNFQDFMHVNGQRYWKLNYNVVREHNKPSELVETLQGLSDESLKLPLSGTYDKFKARLRDWLRFLCINGH